MSYSKPSSEAQICEHDAGLVLLKGWQGPVLNVEGCLDGRLAHVAKQPWEKGPASMSLAPCLSKRDSLGDA
jgi:hypothetical protein